MKFLKCYRKLINIGLHLIVLSLAVVAICLSFNFELFKCSETALNNFEIFTRKDLSFTYQGLLSFTDTMIEFSNKNTFYDTIINIKEVLAEVKVIKVLMYSLLSLHALLAILQLFAYRIKTTFVTCALTTIVMIVLRIVAIVTFKESGLIEAASGYLNAVTILWLVATLVSLGQILLNNYINKAK